MLYSRNKSRKQKIGLNFSKEITADKRWQWWQSVSRGVVCMDMIMVRFRRINRVSKHKIVRLPFRFGEVGGGCRVLARGTCEHRSFAYSHTDPTLRNESVRLAFTDWWNCTQARGSLGLDWNCWKPHMLSSLSSSFVNYDALRGGCRWFCH